MQGQWKDAYGPVLGRLIEWTMVSASRSPKQGSYSALWALISPEVAEKNQNGYYFTDPGQEGKESAQASDADLGNALWNLSNQLIREKLGHDGLVDWNKREQLG